MNTLNFTLGSPFTGASLTDTDLPKAGHMIGIREDLIHANLDVETGNRWTDSKGRLPILYEPHVAYRNATTPALRDKLVKAGVAYPKWGEKPYPADSYPRLLKAFAIDPQAALKACSVGGPQIMGEEYKMSGYADVFAMWNDMQAGCYNQLVAMMKFVKSKKLDDDLRKLQAKLDKGQKVTPDDCISYVEGYNGSGFRKNDYHTKFAKSLNKWALIPDTPWTPDAINSEDLYDGKYHKEVFDVQELLDKKKYPEVGAVDGKYGSKTATAIMAFRRDNGLPLSDKIDPDFVAALAVGPDREIAPARANATVDDLRKEDVPEIKQTDQTKLVSQGLIGVSGLAAGKQALDVFKDTSGTVAEIVNTIQPVWSFLAENVWLIGGALGAFFLWKSGVLQKIRLAKHQTGEDVSA